MKSYRLWEGRAIGSGKEEPAYGVTFPNIFTR